MRKAPGRWHSWLVDSCLRVLARILPLIRSFSARARTPPLTKAEDIKQRSAALLWRRSVYHGLEIGLGGLSINPHSNMTAVLEAKTRVKDVSARAGEREEPDIALLCKLEAVATDYFSISEVLVLRVRDDGTKKDILSISRHEATSCLGGGFLVGVETKCWDVSVYT